MNREHLKFSVTVLGSNSALPKSDRFPSAQVVNVREKLFLIDCGEGTQIQLRRFKQKISSINHIFISHLHGDHCFGLPGLISTFNLLGRSAPLHIYAHADLEKIVVPYLSYFEKNLGYKLIFKPFNPRKNELIYDDKSIEIYTIPLKHRVPSAGFLIREKERERNIKKEMIAKYSIALREIAAIKKGSDLQLESGEIIPNSELTIAPPKPRSYAYCSDTAYLEKNCALLKGVDLLYHEATFGEDYSALASKTGHSTARQAGQIAKMSEVKQLVIGHFSSRYITPKDLLKQAKEVFDNVVAAEDGLEIEIK